MILAQADTGLNTTAVTTPTQGLDSTTIAMGILIIAVIAVIVWALYKGKNDRYTTTGQSLSGSKGGHVKKRVTEYEEVPDEELL